MNRALSNTFAAKDLLRIDFYEFVNPLLVGALFPHALSQPPCAAIAIVAKPPPSITNNLLCSGSPQPRYTSPPSLTVVLLHASSLSRSVIIPPSRRPCTPLLDIAQTSSAFFFTTWKACSQTRVEVVPVPNRDKNALLTWERCLLRVNVTENVEVHVGETVQVNEGEDVSLIDGEAVQVNEGEDVSLIDGEAVRVNGGEDVSLNDGEAVQVSEGDGVALNDDVQETEQTLAENTHDDVELEDQNLEETTDVEGAESDTSEDSVRGIHFDDSEEERVIDTDDGFRHDVVGEAETELNERLNNMNRQAGSNINAGGSDSGQNEGRRSRQRGEPSGSRQHGEPSVVGLVAPEVANMHTMEEEYDSEELLSGAENSDIEGDGKPRSCYELCYGEVIAPINGQQLWPKTGGEIILPPTYKPGAGRPKKLRRREPDEANNSTRYKRSHTTLRCSRCQELGHNSRSCKAPPVNPSPAAESETTNIGTQQSQQAQQTTQTAQGKGKSTSQPQLSQQSQGRSHHTMVTRSSQNSQQRTTGGASTSKNNTKKRKTMTKSSNDTTKGATQWKRGKKKSVPPGPAIPDFARNMKNTEPVLLHSQEKYQLKKKHMKHTLIQQ
ncbi:hypothetical protein SESBI_41082 [Sesbania bispinosa]|nr:hypothetical protein SESBI_41082 [Sesbania bispinosa]